MSQENVEIVRRIYAAWTRDGPPTDSGLLDAGIEWKNPPDAIESGTRTGIDAFGAAAGAVTDTFDDSRVEFERFIDAGDRVVVIGTLRGRGRGSGAEVERRQGYVWTIRDGKAIRFEWFTEPGQALEAAGVSESDG